MTFSIRNSCGRLSLAMAVLAGGCSMHHSGEYQAADHDPVLKDPAPDIAAAHRNFEPSTQGYPGGVTIAFPIYHTTYQQRPGFLYNEFTNALVDVPIFLIDLALLPARVITQAPWHQVAYPGAQYGRSMTVAPPLPGKLPPDDKSEVPGNPNLQPMQ